MSEKLNPCPFCGGEAELKHSGMVAFVECCHCHAKSCADCFDDNDSIAVWNKRNLPRKQLRQALLQILNDAGLNSCKIKDLISMILYERVEKFFDNETTLMLLSEHFTEHLARELYNKNFTLVLNGRRKHE